MTWRKLGRIYVPDGRLPWACSHAANPVAEPIDGDLFRIYFSSRDDKNRSSIGFVEIDITDPTKILRESVTPVLGPGDLAMFDDSGASIGCIVRVGQKRYLYYMGWRLTVTVPWQNALGGKFRMWYGSNTAWGARKEDMRHLIKYAESTDGIHWTRNNTIAIDFDGLDEYAICKPCVRKDRDRCHMWFCARGKAYRIYHAESHDGITWRRTVEPVIDVSDSGWDSEMVEYPFVFDHKSDRYMLYAGNGFGRTGFGIAVLD